MAGAMATGLGGSQRVSKMRRLTDNKVSWFHKADNQGSKTMQSAHRVLGLEARGRQESRPRRHIPPKTRGLRPPPCPRVTPNVD